MLQCERARVVLFYVDVAESVSVHQLLLLWDECGSHMCARGAVGRKHILDISVLPLDSILGEAAVIGGLEHECHS